MPVLVVVEPEGAGREARVADPGRRRHVGERPVAAPLEQPVGAESRQIDIDMPVVVEIGRGAAHAIQRDVETGAARDVGEPAVAVVAIEHGVRGGGVALGPGRPIDQQNVLPPVRVDVEPEHAGAEGLRHVLRPERAVGVAEQDAGGFRHIGEREPGRGRPRPLRPPKTEGLRETGHRQRYQEDQGNRGWKPHRHQRGPEGGTYDPASERSPTSRVLRCSWIGCRSLVSSGLSWRYGPVIACALSSALNRAYS